MRLGHSLFFSKCSKFDAHFRNGIKNPENVLRFWDKCVCSCWRKFCLLRQEYLSSAGNVLANSLKIYDHITIKQSFSNWLYLEFMGKKHNSGALLLSTVFGTPLTLRLPNSVLKQDLLDVSVATFFRNNNFGNDYSRTLILFFKMFEISCAFQKWNKKSRKSLPFFR